MNFTEKLNLIKKNGGNEVGALKHGVCGTINMPYPGLKADKYILKCWLKNSMCCSFMDLSKLFDITGKILTGR